MRHRKHTFKIGKTSSHRRAMLANMTCSLLEHGEIQTTLVKAKELRRFAEKLITYGKKGDLNHRRLAVAKLRSKDAVKSLFDEVALRYTGRQGGYTRIIRLEKRIGDAADMCILQLVDSETAPAAKKTATKKAEKKAENAEVKA